MVAAYQLPLQQVEEAYQDDWGRGIVRIHYSLMKKLGLITSDLVEINSIQHAEKKVGAIVIPKKRDDRGVNIIRIDQYIRHNVGVTLGSQVRIRRIDKRLARKIIFAPVDPKIRLVVKPTILKERLINRPIIKGETLSITGKIRLIPPDIMPMKALKTGLVKVGVSSTDPDGIVIVTSHTELLFVKDLLTGFLSDDFQTERNGKLMDNADRRLKISSKDPSRAFSEAYQQLHDNGVTPEELVFRFQCD